MKIIQLGGKAANGRYVKVDDADYECLNKFKWHIDKDGYAVRRRGAGKVSMHRQIMGCNKGDGKKVDHQDRDTLNCQRYNLRMATSSQNGANRKSTENSTSKYLGVHWNTQQRRWKSSIRVNGKRIYVGYFKKEADAAKAYNEAAIKHHGEFASLNSI